MGKLREEIALKDLTLNDEMQLFLMDFEVALYKRCSQCGQYKKQSWRPNEWSAKLRSLVCKRIEGVENPFPVTTRFNDPRYMDKLARLTFEKARKSFIDAIKEE